MLEAADVERGKVILAAPERSVTAEETLHGAETGYHLNRSGQIFSRAWYAATRATCERGCCQTWERARSWTSAAATFSGFVDRMVAEGLSGSRVRNVLNAARAVFRYAVTLDEIEDTPIKNLILPSNRGRRERIADPVEARALLAAAPEEDQPVWAMAIFAGLRAGELKALRWRDVDLPAGTIAVERSWDSRVGAVEPKSASARRTVPIVGALRPYLLARQIACAWSAQPDGLVFGSAPGAPSTTEP